MPEPRPDPLDKPGAPAAPDALAAPPVSAPPALDTAADARASLTALHDLVALLSLQQTDSHRFLGHSLDVGSPAVFGGQVLGQALMAAARTVKGQSVHSLHGYFLRAGDKSMPIEYAVDALRDGASFGTRRVVALQNGEVIFHMSASFHRREDGVSHQDRMPAAPPPESLGNDRQRDLAMIDRLPPRMHPFLRQAQAIDVRSVDPLDPLLPEARPAQALHWLRAVGPLPDDPLVHQALLAYASDWSLLRVAMLPHQLSWNQPGVQGVSLDHAMWLHRDFRFDDWLLYQSDSPSLAGARGFCRGSLWTRDGQLVASVAQEGLIRVRPPR